MSLRDSNVPPHFIRRRDDFPNAVALRAFILTLLVAVTTIPSAYALDGTEDNPELIDASNDVEYSPLHVGARASNQLDILAGWFEYDNTTDELVFVASITDASNYLTPPSPWIYSCVFRVEGVSEAGDPAGTVFFEVAKGSGESQVKSEVVYDKQGRTTKSADMSPWPHKFHVSQEARGYLKFSVDRARAWQVADELRNPGADCYEDYAPGVASLYTNSDAASSKGAYSLKDLRRTRSAYGAIQPWEATETAAPTPPTDSTAERTAGLSAGAALSCLFAAVLVFQSRQRP